MRILPGYVSCSFASVGFTRAQNGHWKSENSMTVTGAPAGPLAGLPASLGAFLAGVLLGVDDPIQGALDISTIVIAVIGAIIAVVVFNAITGRARTGRGAI